MREFRWASEEGEGIEHFTCKLDADGFSAESVVVGQRDGRAYGLHYRARGDMHWHTRYAWLKIAGGAELELHGDGAGHWHDGEGVALGVLDGCIDIDIAATPFTNTLPIRRLQLSEGERRAIAVAYISTPDLQVTRAEQAYVCLKLHREYRYEGRFRAFTADLSVDDDGFVIDYPTLFTRLPRVE